MGSSERLAPPKDPESPTACALPPSPPLVFFFFLSAAAVAVGNDVSPLTMKAFEKQRRPVRRDGGTREERDV